MEKRKVSKKLKKKKSIKETWKYLEEAEFDGPKTNCVDDIDRLQGVI